MGKEGRKVISEERDMQRRKAVFVADGYTTIRMASELVDLNQ